MNYLFTFLLSFFLLFPQSDFTPITGVITSKNKPLEGAKIKWHSTNKKSYGVVSDSYGRYQLNIKAGDTQGRIEISFPKKDTLVFEPTLSAGQSYLLNVSLKKSESTYEFREEE